MKVSVEWVNSYLPKKLSTREMVDAMERAGIEVEEVQDAQPFDKSIVVGQVADVTPHSNADKLRVAKVNTGSQMLDIVCGASNLEKDQLVVVATVGSVLPDGTKIQKTKIRGEASEGMICSERELGLGIDHNGIMVLKEGKLGQKIAEVFTTKSIIDVKTSANRWDLTSIIGIVREVAAQTAQNTMIKSIALDFGPGEDKPKRKSTLDKMLVNIYMLAPVNVDMTKDTPSWMKQRLLDSGVRPINIIVDITNYIMLEYGQPLHAFDADKVKGEIDIRLARKGEKLTTLDGVERSLDPADIVIADSKGAIGLAGVMGAANSEIDHTTTRILIEAASFDAASIRKTAIRHGLRSEASARFERSVPAYPHEAMAAALELFKKHSGGKLSGGITIWHNLDAINAHTTLLSVNSSRIAKLLGMNLSEVEVIKQLQKLGFGVEADNAIGLLSIRVPWWRPDVKHEADIAEEIIKLIGYDKLSSTLPQWRPEKVSFDQNWTKLWQAKSVLRSLDMFEVATYSFISKKQIEELGWSTKDFYELANPKSTEQAYLRKNLLPSLLATAVRNRKYAKQFAMFEISKGFVMNKSGELPNEQLTLGILAVAPEGAYAWVKAALDRLAREFNIQIMVKPGQYDKQIGHPKRSGFVMAGDETLGMIGQLHPDLANHHKINGDIGYLEINWNVLSAAAKPRLFTPLSSYPTIERDITVIIERTTTWQQIIDELSECDIAFMGDYYGADLPFGKKSLTLRLTISRFDRTPTESDADTSEARLMKALSTKFNATVRK